MVFSIVHLRTLTVSDCHTSLSQCANLQGVKMLCSNAEGASLKGCNFEDPSGLKANLEGKTFALLCTLRKLNHVFVTPHGTCKVGLWCVQSIFSREEATNTSPSVCPFNHYIPSSTLTSINLRALRERHSARSCCVSDCVFLMKRLSVCCRR